MQRSVSAVVFVEPSVRAHLKGVGLCLRAQRPENERQIGRVSRSGDLFVRNTTKAWD